MTTPAPPIIERVLPPAVTFENSTGRDPKEAVVAKPLENKHQKRKSLIVLQQPLAAHLEAVPDYWALHGNAFNPDTEKLTQY